MQPGRTLARCVDMFVRPAAVFYAGTGYSAQPNLVVLDEECVATSLTVI